MKKKTLNSVLLILCLVIYSALFFKVFKKNKPVKDSTYSSVEVTPLKKPTEQKQLFQLHLPERDPFLDKAYYKKTNKTLPKTVQKKQKTNTKIALKWPTINYYGFVKNGSSNKRLVLLKIDNKLHKKRENDKINDLLIIKAYSDSIVLKLEQTKKTYTRINH